MLIFVNNSPCANGRALGVANKRRKCNKGSKRRGGVARSKNCEKIKEIGRKNEDEFFYGGWTSIASRARKIVSWLIHDSLHSEPRTKIDKLIKLIIFRIITIITFFNQTIKMIIQKKNLSWCIFIVWKGKNGKRRLHDICSASRSAGTDHIGWARLIAS